MPRPWKRKCVLALLWTLSSAYPQAEHTAGNGKSTPVKESLHYSVEWRLITAGKAVVSWEQGPSGWTTGLKLESTGLVSKLFRVEDAYSSSLAPTLCAQSSFLTAHEGSRHRETKITFDAARGKASYLERDLAKDTLIDSHELDVPPCTHDVVGGLYKMRLLAIEPGQSAQVPLTDGKKSVMVRVEAQQREAIKTNAGQFKTVRYEAHLFNNVLYRRTGRVFIWLTDDSRRLPVQVQVRLQFHIGTITLRLEKEES